MSIETTMQKFTQQIYKDYQALLKSWLQLKPQEIIESSAEIAATRQCYFELTEISLEDEEIDRLLGFQNPLEAVRDQYLHQTDERRCAAIEETTNVRLAVEQLCEDQQLQEMSGYSKGVTMC